MDQVQELMETSCSNRRVGWPWLLAKGHIHHSVPGALPLAMLR